MLEILTNAEAAEVSHLEGAITEGRSWVEYEFCLRVHPTAFAGEGVMNFGSGASHLERDLENLGFSSRVVELDSNYDPYWNSDNEFRSSVAKLLDMSIRYGHFSTVTQEKLMRWKRTVAKTEGRDIVQGDGRFLPFADQSFGYLFGVWSTYQIPIDAKEAVFRELLRVGKRIHLYPIFGRDFDILSRIAPELGHEVVTCFSLDQDETELPKFRSATDYTAILSTRSESERITRPSAEDCTINKHIFLGPVASSEGGSTIVLQHR